MKSSDSLDCNNSALGNRFSRISDCFSAPFFSADQIHFRTTFITAYRLCIVSSGRRSIVFFRTVRTHRKLFHTGPLTIIRKRIQNRQSRSATGAVDKRMQISPILRIKHFLFAFLTDCDIRRNKNFTLCLLALDDIKLCISPGIFYFFHIYLKDCSPPRWIILNLGDKSFYFFFWSLCIDFHVRTFVTDISVDSPCHRISADGRSKSYPLHDSVDTDLSGDFFTHILLPFAVLHFCRLLFLLPDQFS